MKVSRLQVRYWANNLGQKPTLRAQSWPKAHAIAFNQLTFNQLTFNQLTFNQLTFNQLTLANRPRDRVQPSTI
ncbi:MULTISPECIES: hypothetical protein [unclassified Moorena]|uniref:hypothetical protein n=1 Tax=unclassified Moorena TaxID=2683338 RepID=UPI0013B71CBE|nr:MULTISPECIES: hypothetical protein [unclassified Moorena]NEQ13312.1 hypothetical protein [Moorena sp. SIO3E2]NER89765.1 hypothetical protein [Moorena sp. SIO3A2]NES44064.1 hypothetical protein [Moorena sp. SIO2C4]